MSSSLGALELVLAAVNAVRRIPSFSSAAPGNVAAAVALLVTPDPAGFSPLHHAAAANDRELLDKICSVLKHVRGPFPTFDTRDKNGQTALHWAVQRGNSGAIKSLLDCGASPNAVDARGRSSLHLAVAVGAAAGDRQSFYQDMVRFLLQCGADVSAADDAGATCVHVAAAAGDGEMLSILVELGGAPVNAVDYSGENALFYAVREGHFALVPKLLNYGIDGAATNESQENIVDFCRSLGDEKASAQLEACFVRTGVTQHPDKMDLDSSAGNLFGSVGSGQEFSSMWSSNPAHLLR